jgi:hypothetical protein
MSFTYLLVLVDASSHNALGNWHHQAACQGADPDSFFPDDRAPPPEVLARCDGCPVRLHCLAEALSFEDPDNRHGWWGGLSPDARAAYANQIGLTSTTGRVDDSFLELRRAGLTIPLIAARLGVSERTVYRRLAASRSAA